jgi:hypothetical protein
MATWNVRILFRAGTLKIQYKNLKGMKLMLRLYKKYGGMEIVYFIVMTILHSKIIVTIRKSLEEACWYTRK